MGVLMQPSGDTSLFRLGEWEVDPASNRILRDQQEVRLEPRVMAVLVYLANHAGQVVSRTELESAVWTNMVVSYDSVTSAIQKLRKAFGDSRARPRVIETIPKKGYRLIAPLERQEFIAPTVDRATPSLPVPHPRMLRNALPVTLLVLLLGTLAMGYVLYRGSAPRPNFTVEPKSVAVLPFANLTGNSAQDYLGVGFSDDLITALSRFADLRVTSRESSSLYTDHSLAPSELAEKLNARYLVSGSVQRAGDHLRINAHLVDPVSGSTLWSESFDGAPDEIFVFQERVIRRTVNALVGQINVADRQELISRPQTSNLKAYDQFLLGRQRFFRFAGAQENKQARESFRYAINLDPGFALAHAMLAWTHVFDAMNSWQQPRDKSLQNALTIAQKAIDIDPEIPVAYFVRGVAYRELGDWPHALAEAEKAIVYDPNYAGAHVLLATLLFFDGRAEEGLGLMQRAIALNPQHPFNYSFHLGQAYYMLGKYEEAVGALNRVLESNPAFERAHIWLAAALAEQGRSDEARWEIQQVLASNPDFSIATVKQAYPFRRETDLWHLIDGLHKAGM